MALSAQDLLAIREHQLAYDTLAKGTLDSTLNELKSVLADITSATDLDSLKKELEDKKITLDKQEEILYNNAQVQQDEYNNNINTIKEKNIVLNNKLLKITTLCVNQDGSSKISNKDSYMGITNDLAMLEHNENIIKCGKFIMPQLPNMPPLPLKEIDSLKSGDSLNLSIIEKNHIIELHKYTESLKKTILDSYTLYLNSCTGEKK